uniref:Reverse transcriptase domain-containing protein n=1 Tax=Tanacetum cinerariifolium TaxID=118510 RepID=A0A6L2KFC0_TANCI|nr:hypothetical protein [Tanacetum cinerariifolium]
MAKIKLDDEMKKINDLKELAEYKESLESSSNEIATSNSNQEKEEPPQDSDIRQLIREECGIEVSEEQKQNMENTILELVKICHQKELLCMHDNVDDLIESALNFKLLSINSNSQRLNKEQEVKNVIELAERKTRIVKSFQKFRVIHKNFISLKNTSQISPVHATAPILSTEEPEHSLKSSAKNRLPISSECEVTSEDEFESLSNHDSLVDSSQRIDHLEEISEPLMHIHIAEEERIKREHVEYISRMEMLFTINPRPRPTVNANIIVESIPSSLIPVQDNNSQWEEIDIVTETDDVLPPSVKNDDDSEGDIRFLEELLSDNSIPLTEYESSDSDHQDDPSFPRPPPEPPNADFELDAGDEILVVMNTIVELECLNPRDELDVSNNDYSSFMFAKVFSFLSAESEDTIFDPGIFV